MLIIRMMARIGPPGAVIFGAGGFLLLSMRQSFTLPGTFGLSPAQTVLIGGGLLVLMGVISGHAYRPVSLSALAPTVMFAASSVIAYGAANSRGMDAEVAASVDQYTLNDVWVICVVMFVVFLIRTEDGLRVAMGSLVIGAATSALFALIEFGTGLDLAAMFRLPGTKITDFLLVTDLMRQGLIRPQGSAGHPLELSAILTLAVPLAAGLYFSARARASRSWPWAACTVIIAAGAVTTVSRSAVVGLAAAVLVMCWRWPIRRLAGLILGTGAVFVGGWVLQAKVLLALIATFAGSSTDSSLLSRSAGRQFVEQHFRDRFWFGHGVGSYPALHQPVLDNAYLGRFMDAGVFGVTPYVAAMVIAIVLAVRASASTDPALAELAGGLSGSVAACAVIALILDTGGFTQMWNLTWILVGFAGVSAHLARQLPDRTEQFLQSEQLDSAARRCHLPRSSESTLSCTSLPARPQSRPAP